MGNRFGVMGSRTDNGNVILDVHGLAIDRALETEATIDHITGVVCSGLFARRPADVLMLGTPVGPELLASPAIGCSRWKWVAGNKGVPSCSCTKAQESVVA